MQNTVKQLGNRNLGSPFSRTQLQYKIQEAQKKIAKVKQMVHTKQDIT